MSNQNQHFPPHKYSSLVSSPSTPSATRRYASSADERCRFFQGTLPEHATLRSRFTAQATPKLHGPGYGLDEVEAFRSEVAGVIEAMTAQEYPKDLVRITFVERDKRRSKRLSRVLAKVFPDGNIATSGRGSLQTLPEDTQKALRSAGYGSGAKPHVFVAMPFVPEMDDIFYFGIEGPVTAASLLAERADLSTYTGDVMERVRSRIATARLVVADISTSNPNVCLEVGYAWGKGVPTVLLVKKGAERPFDLRGQRCIVYATIRDLASQLARELQGLEAHNS